MKDKFGFEYKKDYSILKLTCYICERKNHVFIDCPSFKNIVGNIWKRIDRIKSILILLIIFIHNRS